MTKTAKIYGDSLYDLAAEEKLTEEILPQMEQVAVLFKENPDYLTLLSEPSIPKTERVGLLDKAFEGQLSLYLLNFLKLLCESGMLREYRDSCRQFKAALQRGPQHCGSSGHYSSSPYRSTGTGIKRKTGKNQRQDRPSYTENGQHRTWRYPCGVRRKAA